MLINDDKVLYVEDFPALRGRTSGNIKEICPFCHDERTNKHDKALSISCETLAYHCHYCGASGVLRSRTEESLRRINNTIRKKPVRTYKKPSVKPNVQPTLDAGVVEYFKGRGISERTLLKAKVTKETHFFSELNTKRGCIAFNYYLDGEYVNTKFRTREKHFTFWGGARIIPYNIDSIAPSAYKEGERKYCIITEGEADTLTYIECGFEHVISMPAGANSNLEWMDDFIDSHFEHLEVIYVSTDSDQKGVEAKNELVRRFGEELVKVVQYPEGCKDINEVLVAHGSAAVKECFDNAVDVRPKGIIEITDVMDSVDDLYENGLSRGVTVGVEGLDRILSFKTGMLTVVTGVPSHGKTYALNFMLTRLNIIHGWKTAFFSPEFYPVREHIAQIIETLGGARFKKENYSRNIYELLKEYTGRNFFWIDPDDTDINNVLDRARFLIRKKGIRALVIDPFNALTDKERKTQKQDEYISEFLQRIRWFARKYDVAVFLVMHPTKQQKLENGLYPKVDLYACKGASEISDKADIGITVWRNEQENYAEIIVTKMKFRHLGEKGHATFRFNMNNGRFVELFTINDKPQITNDADIPWDNSNWVVNMKNNVSQPLMQYEPQSDLPFDAYQGDNAPPF